MRDISPAIYLLLQKHEHLLRSLLKYASSVKMSQKLWATFHIAVPTYVRPFKWIPEESGELLG